jgi:hypothetical protein
MCIWSSLLFYILSVVSSFVGVNYRCVQHKIENFPQACAIYFSIKIVSTVQKNEMPWKFFLSVESVFFTIQNNMIESSIHGKQIIHQSKAISSDMCYSISVKRNLRRKSNKFGRKLEE